MDRYHRQILLPAIGQKGQQMLRDSRVLLVGCGALGTVIADQLVRAGVGFLRLVDRDLVELTNLQRQVLFDEQDARESLPKAIAAANRLRRVNSAIAIEPHAADLDASNIEDHVKDIHLILDGTDNVATRYLVNDVAVKHQINWIYGAAVATEGRVMTIRPGQTPCLRCVFPHPPAPGELPTCDTAGILAPVSNIIASLQVIEAIKLLTGQVDALSKQMQVLNLWMNRMQAISLADAMAKDCPTCGLGNFEFLDVSASQTTSLCGRDAIQIHTRRQAIDLDRLQQTLSSTARLTRTPYFLKAALNDPAGIELTIFPDARTIVRGTTDPARARAIFSRFVGD